ncbi:glycosyl hydrolase 1 [Asimina triloba]
MGISSRLSFSLCYILFLAAWASCDHSLSQHEEITQNTSPFPEHFLFGTASSAYQALTIPWFYLQFEGAVLADGKGLNNWDIFSHIPGKILDGSNGDIAVDQYHRYLGRFGGINSAGIDYYNSFIDALLAKGNDSSTARKEQMFTSNQWEDYIPVHETTSTAGPWRGRVARTFGIQPFVTLSHYDIPQELEDRYGSWLNSQIQYDFAYYADLCFRAFGDRVKYWVTFNEPNIVAMNSYRTGTYPPSRCSGSYGNCSAGNSVSEPLIAAHNIILSHAIAVDIYRMKYQEEQGGSIGIVINAIWFEPISNKSVDIAAAERARSFVLNWFLDPIIFGRYPAEMQDLLGSALPTFSQNDLNKLKKGLDFIGINHYTSLYVKDCIFSPCEVGMGNSRSEGYAFQTARKDGVDIGEPTAMEWYYVYPQGMEKTVLYLKDRYDNIPMFIAENGYPDENSPDAPIESFLQDTKRIESMTRYLDALTTAISCGIWPLATSVD